MGKTEFQTEFQYAVWRAYWNASGVRTVGMRSKGFMWTREIHQSQTELVGSDKLIMRGGTEGRMEVRLADSTLRSGEPVICGSGQQLLNRLWATWALSKERLRTSMQREDNPVMTTGLQRIAAKARSEAKFQFTSLSHHITREKCGGNRNRIPLKSASGCDGQTVLEAKENFNRWVDSMLQSVHSKGYQAPPIRRAYIPKPGK